MWELKVKIPSKDLYPLILLQIWILEMFCFVIYGLVFYLKCLSHLTISCVALCFTWECPSNK